MTPDPCVPAPGGLARPDVRARAAPPRSAPLSVESLERVAVFTFGADGIVRSWSAGAVNLTGYPPAAVIGRPLSMLLAVEGLSSERPELVLAPDGSGGVAEHQGWWLRRDGTRFWGRVWLSPAAGPDAAPGTLVASLVDLSDWHTEHTRLAEREQCFRSLFAASPDAVLTLDLSARVTGMNPAAAALLAGGTDPVVGESCSALMAPRCHAAARAAFHDAMRGEARTIPLDLQSSRGSLPTLDASFLPMHVGGQVAGVFLSLHAAADSAA